MNGKRDDGAVYGAHPEDDPDPGFGPEANAERELDEDEWADGGPTDRRYPQNATGR